MSIIAGLIGGASVFAYSHFMKRRERQDSLDQYHDQRRFQVESYRREQQYRDEDIARAERWRKEDIERNTMQSRMNDARNAGLHPMAALGGMGGGGDGGGRAPMTTASSGRIRPTNTTHGQEHTEQLMQGAMVGSQVMVDRSQAILMQEEAERLRQQNATKSAEALYDQIRSQINVTNAEANKLKQEITNLVAEHKLIEDQTKRHKRDTTIYEESLTGTSSTQQQNQYIVLAEAIINAVKELMSKGKDFDDAVKESIENQRRNMRLFLRIPNNHNQSYNTIRPD